MRHKNRFKDADGGIRTHEPYSNLSISIKEFPIQDLNLWLPIDSRVFLAANTNQELIYTSGTAEVQFDDRV